jgi:hypothetical protein
MVHFFQFLLTGILSALNLSDISSNIRTVTMLLTADVLIFHTETLGTVVYLHTKFHMPSTMLLINRRKTDM